LYTRNISTEFGKYQYDEYEDAAILRGKCDARRIITEARKTKFKK